MPNENAQMVVEYNVCKDAHDYLTLYTKKEGVIYGGVGSLNNNPDADGFYCAVKSILAGHDAKGEQYKFLDCKEVAKP